MAKTIDSLECGKCGEIFHQLEGFIKHKMSNCTPIEKPIKAEDPPDSDKDSKKFSKLAVKKSSLSEVSLKGVSKMSKSIEKFKKNSPQVLKHKVSTSTPKMSKSKMMMDSDVPKLKGVTGYLWKKRLMQEKLKEQKRKGMMHGKRKSMSHHSDEDSDQIMDSSDSDDSDDRDNERCGLCPGCLIEEDCMECQICLKKMEYPDIEAVCLMRECTAETEEEVYKVEKILAKRFRHGRYEYLIKWKGYPNSDNTWEPKENILSRRLLEEFEEKYDRLTKRKPVIPFARKKRKYYYTESSDSSQDELRASRMFSPASPMDSKRGRSSKNAAMNFIKTVCLKGRRPSPDLIDLPMSMMDSDSSRSPSPEPPAKKKVIIEVPDPKEAGKYIRVKGEARKIRFLKDCDLNPIVELGEKVPTKEEDIQALVFEDIINRRISKLKDKEIKVSKIPETKVKPTGLQRPKSNESDKFIPKVVTPIKTSTPILKLPQKTLEDSQRKRLTYQDKIDTLKTSDVNSDYDIDMSYDDPDDPDDALIEGESKTLAELRESFLKKSMKKTEPEQKPRPKPVEPVPKAGARKNFQRAVNAKSTPPVTPKSTVTQPRVTSSSFTGSKGSPIGGTTANERVFVVMPDGSMVEVSHAATTDSSTPGTKAISTPVQKKAPMKDVKSTKKLPQKKQLGSDANDNDDNKYLKLPNMLQMVQSELPLTEAENNSKLIGMFLFRQVISPNDTVQKCLLCPSKANFRHVLELEKHYSNIHELASQTFKAEFSENIVFVCVPPDVTEQTTLNSNCRFCEVTLKNLAEVRSHYPVAHNKVVRLVQEKQVVELSKSLFCSICSEQSDSFEKHHAHMKSVHRMHTLVCNFCKFITSRANRLRQHIKTTHPTNTTVSPDSIGAKGSKIKLKCPVCQLFINGKVNLDQHILLSHSVQTGPETWSCAKCLRPCSSARDFTVHVFTCATNRYDNAPYKPAFVKQTSCVYKCNQCAATFISENLILQHLVDSKHTEHYEVVRNVPTSGPPETCFLCEESFVHSEMCKKHYLHTHMVWSEKTPIKHNDSNNASDVISCKLKMEEIPDKEELNQLKFASKIGNYCHICDTVISSYSLYYLHMQDLHSSEKCFQCIITSCGKTFTSPTEFKKHIRLHPQNFAYNCSICDATFVNEEELKEHNVSVEHGSQYMKMHEKCRPSGIEARNHQCKICQTWFGLRHYLVQHMENDSHDYKCQKCGLQFLQPGSRRLHIQQMHTDIATVCEFCGIKLTSTQAVWAHLKSHGIVHECTSCHRRFLHKEQVLTHMEAHDPPVQCPWKGCTRQLVTKISLYYHLKTHRGDENHKCPFCEKEFIKQKLLEAHMRTHEADAAAAQKKAEAENDEKESSEAKSQSESELIQLVCAGCEKGFDDEDQFASHKCKSETENEMNKLADSPKQSEIPIIDTEKSEAAVSDEKLFFAESEEPTSETKTVDEPDEPEMFTQTSQLTEKSNADSEVVDKVSENSAEINLMEASESPKEESGKVEKDSEEEKVLEVVSENSEDVTDKALSLDAELSNSNDEKKEFLDRVLSMSNQESNDGSAHFDELSSEMALAIDKDQVMQMEDSESAASRVDLPDTIVSQETDAPASESDVANQIPDKFLEPSSQSEFSEPADTEQQIISNLASIGEDSSIDETLQSKDDEAGVSKESSNGQQISSEPDQEQTVVMMVADHQDDSQEMELELADDGTYAGATLLKVPTSDGKQVLLIPFSSADGTQVLSLPPGLTLETDGSPHGQNIQIALEDTGSVDENGEQRFLHVPVEGMGDLLQAGEDIQVEEKMATDSIVSDSDISLH
ncbi:uncharacterized protein [Parasteatoda tepidariorum]|nr:uncharacterized protein LOC107451096 [Parasteatoda tepidariorum]XP_015922568.1 uncharacterized protein LOC107451096 [Parasteatoda tepidariorum]XP_015922569.1 uncharacterized protein LOC107451096 [Parasteatoda tepidariorum]XP_015922570.1 uncharacterized protein LOC107451096 [Parasteatoda tepidariorum]XP_015922572.1 uncharacterized protein LOC107451096 [Parasteatoda tepidariorum]